MAELPQAAGQTYIGDELTLFAGAHRWKAYYASILRPYIRGDVLEVGAGFGGTTRALLAGRERTWLCVEPDASLAQQGALGFEREPVAPIPEWVVGDIRAVPADRRFDSILYIDVLEHIEDDHRELARSARLLKPGGALVVLAPAFNLLFSEFDRHIGHYRRYTKASLNAAIPPHLARQKLVYLDSVGMLLSLGNRLFLKSRLPTERQVQVWDRYVVPCSRCLDPLLRWCVGKSVVGIWVSTGPQRDGDAIDEKT